MSVYISRVFNFVNAILLATNRRFYEICYCWLSLSLLFFRVCNSYAFDFHPIRIKIRPQDLIATIRPLCISKPSEIVHILWFYFALYIGKRFCSCFACVAICIILLIFEPIFYRPILLASWILLQSGNCRMRDGYEVIVAVCSIFVCLTLGYFSMVYLVGYFCLDVLKFSIVFPIYLFSL